MEPFIKDQIAPTLKNLPISLIKSHFMPKTNDAVKSFEEKVGFIKGICHPRGDLSVVKEANIEWTRFDIPFPFKSGKEISESYESFKERARRYKEAGLRIMAVTPYPQDFLEYGLDIRDDSAYPGIEEVSVFLAQDLQGLVDAFQITNEVGIPRFTLPFTVKECSRFIGETAKAMMPVKGNIPVGYNSGGPQADLHEYLRPYLDYIDYVGIDIYMGCFFFGTMGLFSMLMRYLWAYTRKPVILCEFGYISGGAPKSKAEKLEIIRSHGAKDKKDAIENIERFVDGLPERMREYVKRCAQKPERYAEYIFHSEFTNHFFRELPKTCVIPGYPHTPEGQAKFYSHLIPKLRKTKYLAGAFIYCWSDDERCYVCGQSDCPTETRWGLVSNDGEKKPSFYAVQRAFKD